MSSQIQDPVALAELRAAAARKRAAERKQMLEEQAREEDNYESVKKNISSEFTKHYMSQRVAIKLLLKVAQDQRSKKTRLQILPAPVLLELILKQEALEFYRKGS